MLALLLPRTTAGRFRLAAMGIVLALAALLAINGTNSTGAYFTAIAGPGTMTGELAKVDIQAGGGVGPNHMDLSFSKMLPGQAQAVDGTYKNTGNVPVDVWVTFPSVNAVSALNDLGQYGQAKVIDGNGNIVFESVNLNDHQSTCPNANKPVTTDPNDCNPLPGQILLLQNLQPGATGSWSFTFAYAGKLSQQAPVGTTAYWNVYPVKSQTHNDGDPSDAGNGLPYEIVATQLGQQP